MSYNYKYSIIKMMALQRDYDYIFKVCVVGAAEVGKSSLVVRYSDDMFEEHYKNTVGVDFKFKCVKYKTSKVKIQIWDTAGQESFRSLIKQYYQKANAIIIVYDVHQLQSFKRASNYWIDQVRQNAPSQCLIYLFGNKCESKKKIGNEEREWCKRQNIRCFQVSAKTGQGVSTAFQQVIGDLIKLTPKKKQQKVETIIKQNLPKQKKSCC